MLSKNQELYVSLITGFILILFVAVVFILSIIRYRRKALLYVNEKRLMQSQFSETLLQTQLEIQEQTFKNISQEIHDNIGQVLTLAKLTINTMNCDEPAGLQQKINDSKILISKAIQDLRDLSRSMNTDHIVEKGLLLSIEYELELIKRTGTFEIVLKVDGKPYRLEQQKELILFRIVQEILNNIIKYAKATLINVNVQFEPDLFTLTVTDNGMGFDAGKLESGDYTGLGLGIRNMYNRARMIDTDVALKSSVGSGAVVILKSAIKNPLK